MLASPILVSSLRVTAVGPREERFECETVRKYTNNRIRLRRPSSQPGTEIARKRNARIVGHQIDAAPIAAIIPAAMTLLHTGSCHAFLTREMIASLRSEIIRFA
jgi:hypothetical protein